MTGGTLLHRWSTDLELPGFALLLLCMGLTRSPVMGPVLVFVSAMLGAASRLPLRSLRDRLRGPLLIGLMLFLFLALFSRDGAAIGAARGSLLLCKIVSLVVCATVLSATAGFLELARTLRRFRLPSLLVDMGVLAARYVSVLGEDFRSMRTARRLRGYESAANPLRAVRVEAGLIGTLLVRSEERATRVHRAMKLRGYSSSGMPPLRGSGCGFRDVLILAVIVLLSAGLVAADLALRGGAG
ncbi:hypothetical protein JW921_00560 [Candidatus Fermentibacterales bacterium]|nr:hypothetical protein [Candidatus Fermentibacterales bacterium]